MQHDPSGGPDPRGRWREFWQAQADRPLSSRGLLLLLVGWVALFSAGFRYLANPLPNGESQGMTRCENVFFGEPVVWVSPALEGRERELAVIHEEVHRRQIQEEGCVRLANLIPENAVRSEAEAFCAEIRHLVKETDQGVGDLIRPYAYNIYEVYLHGKLLGLKRVSEVLHETCGADVPLPASS